MCRAGDCRLLAIYLVLLSMLLALALMPLAAPLFVGESELAAGLIYRSFSSICHQIPERCFSISGRPLAACHRCHGIYLGLLGGLLFYPLLFGLGRRSLPSPRLFIAASVPIFFDLALPLLGFYANSSVSRALTGLIFGLSLPFYMMPGLADLVLSRLGRPGGTRDGDRQTSSV